MDMNELVVLQRSNTVHLSSEDDVLLQDVQTDCMQNI